MVHNLSIRFHQGLGVEWRLAVQHLVHADAQRPPIALGPILAFTVLHGLKDLWGDVVWSAYGHRGLDLADGHNNNNKEGERESERKKLIEVEPSLHYAGGNDGNHR